MNAVQSKSSKQQVSSKLALRSLVDACRDLMGGSSNARDGAPADRIEQLRALATCYRTAGDLEGWARSAETELATLDPAPVFDDRRRTLRRELAFAYDGPLSRPEPALRHAPG